MVHRWPAVAEVSRKVLGWRLRAMPYLYASFFDSHTYGCPIARPLFFTFPSDANTLAIKEQWMMGVHSCPCNNNAFVLTVCPWQCLSLLTSVLVLYKEAFK